MAKFDFILRFVYDSRLNDGRLSCRFICSHDLFDEVTVSTISRRFKHLFEQLFSSNQTVTLIDTRLTPVSKLKLILPEETVEIKSPIFFRQLNVVNEGLFVYLFKSFFIFDVYIGDKSVLK